jgi:alanyl-tRNA synthetase
LNERLYYQDAYLTQFDAQVVSSRDNGLRVILDRSAFYPSSGGQPHDLGTLNGIPVLDVVDAEDHVEHILAAALESTSVRGEIDWPRRLDHMQQHTAQHLLSAVMQEEFGFSTVSFHLGGDYSTVDVEPATATEETLAAIELRTNEVLRQNRATSVSMEDAALAKGLRKPSERAGEIRIVSIDGIDRSACGGTHVGRTGEIGVIRLGKTEKIRKALRIYFYAGARALAFGRKQLDELARSEAQLREKLAEAEKLCQRFGTELAALRGTERYRHGAQWMECVDEITEALRWEANSFLEGAGAVALLYAPGSGAVLLGAETGTGIDCGKALKAAAAARGGKGGGTARMAQGNLGAGLELEGLRRELFGN